MDFRRIHACMAWGIAFRPSIVDVKLGVVREVDGEAGGAVAHKIPPNPRCNQPGVPHQVALGVHLHHISGSGNIVLRVILFVKKTNKFTSIGATLSDGGFLYAPRVDAYPPICSKNDFFMI